MPSGTHGRDIIAVHPHTDLYGSDRMFLESVTVMAPGVLAVLPQHGPLVDELVARGIPYRIRPFPVLRKVELGTPRGMLAFLLGFLRAVVEQTHWLRRERPEVLYVSTIAAPEWLIAGRLSGTRVLCHVHESEPQWPRLVSAVLLAPLYAADGIIANSGDCLNWIRSALGSRLARRARVVHNGVREPGLVSFPASPSGSHRLVVVGRLSERKGQDVAIAATALVRRAGHDVTLTLVGDGYPGYEDVVAGLHDLVREGGIEDVTVFTGFADPTPHVAAADVVLVPSRIEPFGLVAVEAMLLGRPVVAAAVGGLTEIVEDGVTGRLVPPDDPQALADAVIDLLTNPDRAAGLAAAGLADARARFSAATFSARLKGIVRPAA